MTFKRLIGAALVAAGLTGSAAQAAEFPSKPVTIIVPYGAGGGTDNFVRALQTPLAKALGTEVVVQNIAGGGGAVGLMQTLTKRPDGYTVTIPNNAFYTLQGMGNVTFKTGDFDYIARLVTEPYVLTLRDDPKWKDLEGFVAAAKKAPVKLGFAGVGSSSHVMTIAIANALGITPSYIPYGGGAEASAAMLGGHIDGVVLSPSDVVSALQSGKLITIGSTGKTGLLPDVPLFKDHGFDVDTVQWRGIAAPKGIPEQAKEAWVKALKVAIQDPGFQKAATNLGLTIDPLYGDDLDAFVKKGSDLMIPLTQQIAQDGAGN